MKKLCLVLVLSSLAAEAVAGQVFGQVDGVSAGTTVLFRCDGTDFRAETASDGSYETFVNHIGRCDMQIAGAVVAGGMFVTRPPEEANFRKDGSIWVRQ